MEALCGCKSTFRDWDLVRKYDYFSLNSKLQSLITKFAHDKIHDRVWNCCCRLRHHKIYR